MIVQDTQNRDIEITVCGDNEDDLYIDTAYYVDSDDDVPDDTLDYILDAYAGEIHSQWVQNQVCRAEAWSDSLEDR